MELQIDLTKEYGIVLEGGGAKGSYQIGVWRALREAKVPIRGIAGASVGALNGAMMCMDDMEKAEYIWENISYSRVMNVEDDVMENLIKGNLKSLTLQEILGQVVDFLKNRGFDATPLRQMIGEIVDEEKLRNSDRELYVTTYSLTDRKLLELDIRDIPEGMIADILLACAYFPAFRVEKVGGKTFVDGAGWNNVPINMLLEHGYKDIIVVRIYGLGYDSERSLEVPDDVNLHHIAPRKDLGGILEFDRKRSRKNMKMGYFDAKRFLYGLCGRMYYIDAPGTEAYYFDRMMSESDLFLRFLEEILVEELTGLPLAYRTFTEQLFPQAAAALKLKEGWNYKDLYLAIVEEMARRDRINRFAVYTVDELLIKVRKKLTCVPPCSKFIREQEK